MKRILILALLLTWAGSAGATATNGYRVISSVNVGTDSSLVVDSSVLYSARDFANDTLYRVVKLTKPDTTRGVAKFAHDTVAYRRTGVWVPSNELVGGYNPAFSVTWYMRIRGTSTTQELYDDNPQVTAQVVSTDSIQENVTTTLPDSLLQTIDKTRQIASALGVYGVQSDSLTAVYYVHPNGSNTNSGKTWALAWADPNPVNDLDGAADSVYANTYLFIAPGIYRDVVCTVYVDNFHMIGSGFGTILSPPLDTVAVDYCGDATIEYVWADSADECVAVPWADFFEATNIQFQGPNVLLRYCDETNEEWSDTTAHGYNSRGSKNGGIIFDTGADYSWVHNCWFTPVFADSADTAFDQEAKTQKPLGVHVRTDQGRLSQGHVWENNVFISVELVAIDFGASNTTVRNNVIYGDWSTTSAIDVLGDSSRGNMIYGNVINNVAQAFAHQNADTAFYFDNWLGRAQQVQRVITTATYATQANVYLNNHYNGNFLNPAFSSEWVPNGAFDVFYGDELTDIPYWRTNNGTVVDDSGGYAQLSGVAYISPPWALALRADTQDNAAYVNSEVFYLPAAKYLISGQMTAVAGDTTADKDTLSVLLNYSSNWGDSTGVATTFTAVADSNSTYWVPFAFEYEPSFAEYYYLTLQAGARQAVRVDNLAMARVATDSVSATATVDYDSIAAALAGSGSEPETLFVYDSSNGAVVPYATVVVLSTDTSTTEASASVNVSGYRVFSLDSATYPIDVQAAGYFMATAYQSVAVAGGGGTDTLWVYTFSPNVPAGPDSCIVIIFTDAPGATATFEALSAQNQSDDYIGLDPYVPVTPSDANGTIQVSLPWTSATRQNTKWRITVKGPRRNVILSDPGYTVPDQTQDTLMVPAK